VFDVTPTLDVLPSTYPSVGTPGSSRRPRGCVDLAVAAHIERVSMWAANI
jgi:hypothetical protein